MTSPMRGVPNWRANFPDLAAKAAVNDPVAKSQLDYTLTSLDEVTSTLLKVAAIGVFLILVNFPLMGLGVLTFIGLNIYAATNTKAEIYEAIHRASETAIHTISTAVKDLHSQTMNLSEQVTHLKTEVESVHGVNESLTLSCQAIAAAAERANAATEQLENSFHR